MEAGAGVSGTVPFFIETLSDKVLAWRTPINKDSGAFADGRSKAPPPPDEYSDEMWTAALNNYFHGALYRPEDIQDLPDVFLQKMALLLNG